MEPMGRGSGVGVQCLGFRGCFEGLQIASALVEATPLHSPTMLQAEKVPVIFADGHTT